MPLRKPPKPPAWKVATSITPIPPKDKAEARKQLNEVRNQSRLNYERQLSLEKHLGGNPGSHASIVSRQAKAYERDVEIRALYEQSGRKHGAIQEIATKLQVCRHTVSRALKKHR